MSGHKIDLVKKTMHFLIDQLKVLQTPSPYAQNKLSETILLFSIRREQNKNKIRKLSFQLKENYQIVKEDGKFLFSTIYLIIYSFG